MRMPREERSASRGLCQPWMGSSSASGPQHSSLCRGLRLCGEPEPLGLGVNGGCGRGCLVPPLGWCRPWGDKGAGRKAAAGGAGTPVPGMAERPGRAVGGVEPVGTAGARRARLGVGAARGRSASQGRNSVRPVKRVGTTWAGCDGGSRQSGTGSPGF